MAALMRRATASGTTALDIDEVPLAQHMSMAAMIGIAWYNCAELNISVYMTFKVKRGLYYWSVLASIQGVMLHTLAFVLTLYSVIDLYTVSATLITIGWYLMVTGQSLVLYSRLHLVVKDKRIVRGVLAMIIWNAVTLHIPTTVLTYGSNSPSHTRFFPGFHIMEKIQMTIFCIQEFIISGLYIWGTLRFLRPAYRRHIRSVMIQLFWINVLIIIMDVAMLTMEYLENYSLQVIMKSFIYSVKLKLEFAVLNQLMRLVQTSRNHNALSEERHAHSHSIHSSGAQNGFRGFLRRIILRPNTSGLDGSSVGVRQRTLQDTITAGHNRQNQHTYESTVTAQGKGTVFEEELPTNGIHMTREVVQVSTPRVVRKPSQTSTATTWMPSGAEETVHSLDMVGYSLSAKSSHSQMELVTLNSPSSVGTEKRAAFGDEPVDAPPPVVQRTSRTNCASAGGDDDVPYTTSDYGHQLPPKALHLRRSSVSSPKDGSGESPSSSEIRLRME
jgi:hypothetical protein